ncbi:MAG: DNA cytosine methyltransferase [Verrucomicrobiota bacterium]|nr:DNA cytosine methyltransferase [Verrucomicrobiota bacterium]
MNHKPHSLISLFTGAGGLDLGLEQAGFETLVANEVGPHACETLRQNQILSRLAPQEFESWLSSQMAQRCYKGAPDSCTDDLRSRLKSGLTNRVYLQKAKIVERDIRDLPSSEVLELARVKKGQIDLIAGGPPCQPFSRAGKRESVKTNTGRLFKDFVRLVDEVRPRWFLFENVKGLTLTKAPLAHLFCRSCRKTSLVNFDDWEALQAGEKDVLPCYICAEECTSVTWQDKAGGSLDIILNEFTQIGYECSHKILNAADFGAPQQRERLLIVGSRDGEPFQWPKPSHGKSRADVEATLFDYDELQPWRGMGDTLWPKGHWKYGRLGKDAVLWVKNVVRPHDEPVTWSLSRPSPTIGAHQGAKLAIAPFGVPEDQLARQQWHTLGRRQSDTPPVFVEHEYLTDLELMRLQTFPANWYLYGTRMERAFQIGNAVPPVLARVVGEALLAAMDGMGRMEKTRMIHAA